jgi:hypothetical protein
MPHQGDWFILLIIIALLAIWLWIRFRRWLYAPTRVKLPFPDITTFARSEAVELLEASGYEVICGKKKVPLIVEVDEKSMDSRLFVDYFAKKDHELFVVKVAKQRQPIQWTGSGVRERLMPYCYLFAETHGVLYVDVEEGKVRKIRIDIGQVE